ncbi:hypothetical protein MUN77_15480 [Leucobacter allii]|uniref:hypothetical protein n=1 Tax=Leucobacter allii TaxID=2932247 RepID=UPI001FD2C84E|nr:hypothetical protein [Leucobacter allii]UOR01509.1 hypothetical protein MUN77_15480 [Leucobacter allii]
MPRIRAVIVGLLIAGFTIAGLSACSASSDPSDTAAQASTWDGPTDGVWGEQVTQDASLIGFEEPWKMDYAKYRIQVDGVPSYGALSPSGSVDVIGTFTVTKSGETNDPPGSHLGWLEGIRSEGNDASVKRPEVTCENEDLAIGETTTCTAVINTEPAFVENSSWRIGAQDVAAFPGQARLVGPQ